MPAILAPFRSDARVRHEYSTYKYSGSGFDGVTTWPLTSNNSNGQWLPGVHARYAANTDTIIRAALTRSFARPDFADLVPYQRAHRGARQRDVAARASQQSDQHVQSGWPDRNDEPLGD